MSKSCQVPDCGNPKMPGQGGKLCEEHRKAADIWRRRDRHYIPTCQMDGCKEPKLRGRGHKYCAKHNAEAAKSSTVYRERARVREGRRKRERQFGVSHDEFLAMLATQDDVCAICRNGNDGARQLSIDHDHETGAIRGLLCDRCNPMLGYARDQIPVLSAAIEYLRFWSGIQSSGSIALDFRGGVPGTPETDRTSDGAIR